MTNINCTSDCKHQKDGKCNLDTANSVGQTGGECVYYQKSCPHDEKNASGK